MARAFISHAREDAVVAAEVRGWLVEDGHEVFLAQDERVGLAAGEEWEARLFERLRWADVVVCVVTAGYQSSVWCTAEAAAARLRGCRLVPLLVDPSTDHPLLRTLQHIKYRGDTAAARSALRESLRQVDAIGGFGWADGRSPFPGLRPFETDMHRAFFGRSQEIESLAGLVRSPAARADGGMLLVVGPSGCGKSSLVRAGLIPIIADDSDWLTIAPFFPNKDPLAALAGEIAAAAWRHSRRWTAARVRERIVAGELADVAAELLEAASAHTRRRHLLVIVDQFEELLTQTGRAERAAFADALAPALNSSVFVVATMRAESLPDLLASHDLIALPVRTFTLRPLRREALPEVIAGPARLAGIILDDHLLRRMVTDTDTGDALPLLAFTLSELAAGVGRGGTMTIERYRELGGVHGALRRQAEAAMAAACTAAGRSRDEVIAGLLRLVTVDERGQPTRWRVRRDELTDSVRVELDAFVALRLLTTDTDGSGNVLVEVAHEALFSAWPPLADAVRAAASWLKALRAVEQAAREWDDGGRSPRQLWEGNQLAAAVNATVPRGRSPAEGARLASKRPLALLNRRPLVVSDQVGLTARARAFLSSSIRRDRGRRRRLVTALSAMLAVAVATAAVATDQAREAIKQQRVATSRALAAEAVGLSDDPRTAMLLGVQAMRLDPSGDTRASLLATLTQSHLAGIFHTGRVRPGLVAALDISPDGRVLVTFDDHGTTMLWDLTDRTHPRRMKELIDSVGAVAFSPHGHMLATAGIDGGSNLWDLSDLTRPKHIASFIGPSGALRAVAFSPDGRTLATGSGDGTAFLWDITDPVRPERLAVLGSVLGGLDDVVFSPNGRVLATFGAGTPVSLWDITDPTLPARVTVLPEPELLAALSFSAGGSTLTTISLPGTLTVWTVSSLTQPVQLSSVVINATWIGAFSFDGRILGTLTHGDTAVLWDLTDPAHPSHLTSLNGHMGELSTLEFGPDGRTLITVSLDGTSILWDLADHSHLEPLADLPGLTDAVAGAFSPDGRTLATGTVIGPVVVWDVTDPVTPKLVRKITGLPTSSTQVVFTHDGHLLVAGQVTVPWESSDGVHLGPLTTVDGYFSAFSADGRTVFTVSRNGSGTLWGLSDRVHPARRVTLSGLFRWALLSANGNTVVIEDTRDGQIVIWNAQHGARRSAMVDRGIHLLPYAVSPDGLILATPGGQDGTSILWDLRDQTAPKRLATLTGISGALTHAAFSPDGRILATGSEDGTCILWDISDHSHPVRLAILSGNKTGITPMAFTPDGGILFTINSGRTASLWDVSTVRGIARDPVTLACSIAGPALDRTEWARYLPGLPYERTCP